MAIVAALAVIGPASASADCGGGGLSAAEVDICTPTAKAKLLKNGMLVPPKSAPGRVKRVIRAANKIRSKPYIYGGGHARWWDRGYDCSGSVSFALHGGKFLESPLPSGSMTKWGSARRRSLDHRLRQRRPRLRGDRRLPLGHLRRFGRRNRPPLARRTARQQGLRRPPPGRLLDGACREGGAGWPRSLGSFEGRGRSSAGVLPQSSAKRSRGHPAPPHRASPESGRATGGESSRPTAPVPIFRA